MTVSREIGVLHRASNNKCNRTRQRSHLTLYSAGMCDTTAVLRNSFLVATMTLVTGQMRPPAVATKELQQRPLARSGMALGRANGMIAEPSRGEAAGIAAIAVGTTARLQHGTDIRVGTTQLRRREPHSATHNLGIHGAWIRGHRVETLGLLGGLTTALTVEKIKAGTNKHKLPRPMVEPEADLAATLETIEADNGAVAPLATTWAWHGMAGHTTTTVGFKVKSIPGEDKPEGLALRKSWQSPLSAGMTRTTSAALPGAT